MRTLIGLIGFAAAIVFINFAGGWVLGAFPADGGERSWASTLMVFVLLVPVTLGGLLMATRATRGR